MVRATVAL